MDMHKQIDPEIAEATEAATVAEAHPTIDLSKLSATALHKLAEDAKKAEKVAKLNARRQINLPHVTTTLEYDGETPLVTITFPLFEGPSVENGYGKLLIASSASGNRRYLPVAALVGGPHDGKVVEVNWSARIPE